MPPEPTEHTTQESLPQRQSSRIAFSSLVLLVLLVVWLYISGAAATSIEVLVNGEPTTVPSRITVSELTGEIGAAQAPPGDLIDVEGYVIQEGAGGDPLVLVNGRVGRADQRVATGDAVRVIRGKDVTEPTMVEYDYQPVGFVKRGKGPLPLVTKPGQAGITKLTVGKLSGKLAATDVVQEPVEPVVRYSYKPDPKLKVVALTFDDGPNPGETDSILKILERENVRATFFLLGSSVDKHPDLAARIARSGHQVAAHSQTHREFTKLSAGEIEDEILTSIEAIERATGVRPNWVRPPYGSVNGTVFNEIERLSLRPALWSVDPKDWARPGFQKIINRSVFAAHPGAVYLFHDGGGNRSQTVKALPGIIGELRDAGYKFVTIEEYAALAEAHRDSK